MKNNDLSAYPEIPRKAILKNTPTGEISIEQGADGIFLRFDCDCIDALPVCQAQCCALPGTIVLPEELDKNYPVEFDDTGNVFVLERNSDGFCTCLDRKSRMCMIYEDRPHVCRQFHCTKGASQRGWKIPNSVCRQS